MWFRLINLWLSRKRVLHTKNRAYAVFAEFGPNLRIPRRERLVQEFPDVSESVVRDWLGEFENVEAQVWYLVDGVGTKGLCQSSAMASIQDSFPWMSSKTLALVLARIRYFAVHEGAR